MHIFLDDHHCNGQQNDASTSMTLQQDCIYQIWWKTEELVAKKGTFKSYKIEIENIPKMNQRVFF